jgi:tetraacyldisaccharide 4'-kinase
VSALFRIAARAWNDRGPWGTALRLGLAPPAVAYGVAVRSRNFLYDHRWLKAERAAAAVVSVGNLTVGGTGKTPVVIWLAGELEGRGFKVAVLSRGYGRRGRGVRVVGEGGRCLLNVEEAGDEPMLLARRVNGTVIVGESRAVAAEAATTRGANLLLLDDGFQHRALARDFDLLLLDRDRQLANGWTLPAGPLREPSSGARRADALALVERATGPLGVRKDSASVSAIPSGKPSFQMTIRPQVLVFPDGGVWREEPLRNLAGQRLLAVSGIAGAESFYAMLHGWEGRMVGTLEFGDHHRYDRVDWRTIVTAARGADLIVTTEKDLVKLEQFPFSHGSIAALRLGVEVDNAEGLLGAVSAAIDAAQSR